MKIGKTQQLLAKTPRLHFPLLKTKDRNLPVQIQKDGSSRMSAPRAAETSPLRTGLSQLALSLAAFGLVAGLAVGAAMAFGDPDAGGPKVQIALFNKQAAPPQLKAHLDPADLKDVKPAIGKEDDAIPDGGGDGDQEGAAKASFTVTEMGEAKTIQISAASALPKAPILGFYERTPAGDMPKISAEGKTPAEAYARPFVPIAGAQRISIIVRGLGLKDNFTLEAINELPPEVTLSFVPYSDKLQTWIDRARAAGHEVLLELPMEPYDYPNVDTGPQTLLTTATPDENIRRLNLLLGKATGYFGVTNYQGAKFATDEKAAQPVLNALRARGLVFVSDGAAQRSMLPDAAKQAGLALSNADRIIDVETSAEAIDRQLLQLEALAVQNSSAVGMGDAYPVTIEQLRIWTQGLKSKGYQLAPASAAAAVHAITSLPGSSAVAGPIQLGPAAVPTAPAHPTTVKVKSAG